MYHHPRLITSYRMCDLYASARGFFSCPGDSLENSESPSGDTDGDCG